MNLRQMLSNIRTRCDDPMDQRPAERTVLLLLSTQVQRFMNKVNLSGKPWAVDELTLTTAGGVEDYPIPSDSSFGKPLGVRTVSTTDPSHIERDVDFFELGELNTGWGLPQDVGMSMSGDGSGNAARLAFYRKSGTDQVYVRVRPIPQAGDSYKVLYQVGVYGETVPLDETPLLPEHHALIEIRTAIALLPHCQWSEDKAENAAKRKDLAMSLAFDSADLERDFIRYVATMSASTRPSYRDLPFSFD